MTDTTPHASTPEGYRPIDHTADVAFDLWAPSEPRLLVQAARALVNEMTGDAHIQLNASRTFRIEALDAEERLVQWSNEIIYLATAQGFIAWDADIEIRQEELVGTVRGASNAAHLVRSELKSATYHDLQVQRRPDGSLWARLVVDV